MEHAPNVNAGGFEGPSHNHQECKMNQVKVDSKLHRNERPRLIFAPVQIRQPAVLITWRKTEIEVVISRQQVLLTADGGFDPLSSTLRVTS